MKWTTLLSSPYHPPTIERVQLLFSGVFVCEKRNASLACTFKATLPVTDELKAEIPSTELLKVNLLETHHTICGFICCLGIFAVGQSFIQTKCIGKCSPPMWVVGVYFYSVIWAWSELYCNYNISNSHNAHIFKMSSENAFASNTNNVQVLIDCWISCFVLHTHTHTHRTHTI